GAACWGSNANGIFLDASSADTTATPIPGMSDVVAVSLGGGHACGIRRSGGVACWGKNDVGQLGHGPLGTSTDTFPPQDLPSFGSPVLEIGSGIGHTCARLAN